ncbi:hypothetical protein ACP70R_025144 [Stipagrostis hirtigluma subsp. patula]
MEAESEGRRDQGDTATTERQDQDLVRLLPEDALADVLRRLPPWDLASSRCVRKAWRAVVDGRRLLLPHLLPRKVCGIFIKFHNTSLWELFSRPSAGPTVSGKLDFLPADATAPWRFIPPRLDHCNGLFLLDDYVFNPATRWWARLPPRPPPVMAAAYFYDDQYILVDPTVSPYYEVLLIPRIQYKLIPGEWQYCSSRDVLDPIIEKSEWPPTLCELRVFSSRTGKWEQRSCLREGEAASTVAHMRSIDACLLFEKRHAVYWQGDLYVHCEADFVIRISMSDNKIKVIKPPKGSEVRLFGGLYLGRSKSGIHCALVDNCDHPCRLRVWALEELNGQMEWMLKHQSDIGPMLPDHAYDQPIVGPWMLQDINYYELRHNYYGEKGAGAVQERFEWDSDRGEARIK